MDIWFGCCLPPGLEIAYPLGFTLKSTWPNGFVDYPFGVMVISTMQGFMLMGWCSEASGGDSLGSMPIMVI